MKHWKLTQWCIYAVSKIKYGPDRAAVYEELRQHIDDRCENFLQQGLSAEESVDKTVEVMGDPRELAPYLAAAHPCFWGFAYSITKWLMYITAVAALICLTVTGYRLLHDKVTGSKQYYSYIESSSSDRTCILYAEPNSSDTSDGYTFTVTRVAVQQTSVGNQNVYNLFIEVEVIKPYPFSADCYGMHSFWGIDDLGNKYACTPNLDGIKSMSCRTNDSNYFIQYYDFEITYVNLNPSQALKWFELHYDRAGRDVLLHIDLAGGGAL